MLAHQAGVDNPSWCVCLHSQNLHDTELDTISTTALYTAVRCKLLKSCSDKVFAGEVHKQALDKLEDYKTEVVIDCRITGMKTQ